MILYIIESKLSKPAWLPWKSPLTPITACAPLFGKNRDIWVNFFKSDFDNATPNT